MRNKLLMRLRDAAVLAREILQSVLFSFMSHRGLLSKYNASPISFLNKGLLSFVTLVLACIQLYFFYHAYNKNIDAWINILGALAGALLTSTATYGAMIALALGSSFAAGIWVFIAGLVVGVLNQLAQLCINLYRSFREPSGSMEQNKYLEDSLEHAFIMMQLLMAVSAMMLRVVMPFSPMLASICCLTVVALILSQMAWRFGSDDAKQKIKYSVGLSTPELHHPDKHQKPDVHYNALFSRSDYLVQLKLLAADKERYVFLDFNLIKKLNSLKAIPTADIKIQNKIQVLELLCVALKTRSYVPSKAGLQKQYPGTFQSFWLEKGEVEQLYDAVVYYKNTPNPESFLVLN